jgi:hypothetical protein
MHGFNRQPRVVPLAGIRDDVSALDVENAAQKAEMLRLLDLLAASSHDLAVGVEHWQTWSKEQDGGYTGRIDGTWGWKSEQAFVNSVPYAWLRSTHLTDLMLVKGQAAGSAVTDIDLYAVGIARDKWLPTNRGEYPLKIATPPVIDEPEPTRVEIIFPDRDPTDGAVTITPVDPPPGSGAPRYVAITLPDGGTVHEGDTVVITPVEEDLTGGKKRNWIGYGLLALGGTIVVGSVILAGRQSKRMEGR